MSSRYTDWMRFRFDTASGLAPVARKLLGQVEEQRRLGGLFQHERTIQLPDGSLMRARHDGTTGYVELARPGAPEDEAAVTETKLWLPRGFVLYPAADGAPAGWGVPVIQLGDEPYSPQNLAPGLAVTRWTPNGPMGQVLLTRSADAGYPERRRDLLPPLTYHHSAGLHLREDWEPAKRRAWAAYRIEFVAFAAQSPGAALLERTAQIAFKRGVFRLVNEHRAGIGRDPLLLPARGIYDSAQASAECMMAAAVLGHMYEGFPVTYRTPEDRITHDGLRRFNITYAAADGYNSRSYNFNENALASFDGAPDVIGSDPNGVPIYRGLMRLSPMFTPAEAVALWLDSPTHRAMIEREEHDITPGTHGSAGVTNVGVKGSASVQHFMPTRDWLGAGNRQFVSNYAEVPIVSWNGPSSLNLAWETWPCRYRYAELQGAVGEPEVGQVPLEELGRIVDDDGQCQLFRYYEMAAPEGDRVSQEPVWLPYIWCRGRCIAIAPAGALVWACGVIRVRAASTSEPAVHRLVILAHHDDDQPADIEFGMTSYLRVWYCDMPVRDGLALNPESLIRGVFGQEATDDPWPWVVENNPWSWRGGEIVDVGSTNGSDRDALKYAAQWVFRGDGRQAACLRDNSTLHGYLTDIWGVEPGEPLPAYSGPPIYEIHALWPSLWTLDLSAGEAPLVATATFHGRCPTQEEPVPRERIWNELYPDMPAITNDADVNGLVYGVPLAVGYDSTGAMQVAKLQILAEENAGIPMQIEGRGVSFGAYAGALDDSAFTGWTSAFKMSPGTAERPFWAMPLILDIADQAYITVGVPQKFVVGTSGGFPGWNVTSWESTNWFEYADDYATVSLWRAGAEVARRRYPNPDGAVITPGAQFCFLIDNPIGGGGSFATYGIYLPLIAAHTGVADYVRHGDDWLFNFAFQPQPFLALAAAGAQCGDCASFIIGGGQTPGCIPHLGFDTTSAPYGLVHRGSVTASSIADEAALYALMQAPGPGQRVLYARSL